MARTPTRQLVEGRIHYLYDSHSELPWREIEAAVDKQFLDSERKEIYFCTMEYSEELCWHSGGARKADVTKLRNEMLKPMDAICRLAERFQPLGNSIIDPEDRKAMDALSQMHADGKINLGTEFHNVAASVSNLAVRLREMTTFEPDQTGQSPELFGLEKFVEQSLSGANSKPAKRSAALIENAASGVKEYSKWGIPIGPKSKIFRLFVNSVLKENFTEYQVREAFKNVRKRFRRNNSPGGR
ncbi:hypothetical protein ROA7745_04580 [Roseovarius aestuarii]|uniref:Uncharacterized protein n=2 Tax=Roseovarius aestuarii TaxID=475083 RepID=A0A1X7BYW8_9RHOB|nr:hypothetical protein ROA7745_04580 [Roseovarius aestuarii]